MRLLVFPCVCWIIFGCNSRVAHEIECDSNLNHVRDYLSAIKSKSDYTNFFCDSTGYINIMIHYDEKEDLHFIADECFGLMTFLKENRVKKKKISIYDSEGNVFFLSDKILEKHEKSMSLVNDFLCKIREDSSSVLNMFDHKYVNPKNVMRMFKQHGGIKKANYLRSYIIPSMDLDILGEIHIVCLNDKYQYRLILEYGKSKKFRSFDLIGNTCGDYPDCFGSFQKSSIFF